MNVTISIDDFNVSNIEIASRLQDLGMTATFYLEMQHQMTRDQARVLDSMGFDIGSHTMTHPQDMKLLRVKELRYELEESKKIIEDIIGRSCLKFAYPRGRYNDDVVRIVDEAGYKSARTTQVLKLHTTDPLRMPTTVHVYSGRKEYFERSWDTVARAYLQFAREQSGEFHIWGHAKEMIANNDFNKFFAFLKETKTPQPE